MYEERTYREYMNPGESVVFNVVIEETDLWVAADSDLTEHARSLAQECRNAVSEMGREHPEFITSLSPVFFQTEHPLLKTMMRGAGLADVGPMAAVAGAISEYVGSRLLAEGFTKEVFVENGGDIFIHSLSERVISIYAGKSPFSEKLGIRLRADQFPTGICTSAGTVGHSLSFGNADACVILAKDTALADSVATAAGNHLKTPEDMNATLDFVKNIPGITGCVLIIGEHLGVWGDIELIQI